MTRRTGTACALLLLASSACGRTADPEPAPAPAPAATVPAVDTTARGAIREYRGTYSSGYEISWFEPCGAGRGEGPWWVTLSEHARLQRDGLVRALPTRPTRGLAVRWRATVSDRMRGGAGHMGRGTRYMLVTEILSLHPLEGAEGHCGWRETE